MSKYAMTRKLPGGFEDGVRKARAALEAEGFSVSGELRLDKALKKILDADFRRYAVLYSYHPRLAHKALVVEPEVWLLLPGQTVVSEDPSGAVSVSVMDPVVAFSVMENPALAILAKEMRERIERAMASME